MSVAHGMSLAVLKFLLWLPDEKPLRRDVSCIALGTVAMVDTVGCLDEDQSL